VTRSNFEQRMRKATRTNLLGNAASLLPLTSPHKSLYSRYIILSYLYTAKGTSVEADRKYDTKKAKKCNISKQTFN